MRKLSLLLCSALLLCLAACSKSDNDIPSLPAGGGAASGGGEPAPAPTASVSGKISFEGEVPKPTPIQTTADPNCKEKLFTEDTVVKDGGLGNVVIYVSKGFEGKNFAPPSTPVTIDQHDCHYVPHALVVMTNQELQIKNSDMTLHNIHAFPDPNIGNDSFNTGQPVPMVTSHKFTKEEVLLPVKCDVHKWMGAFIAVTSNPFGTVSAPDGKFDLKLPAGTFEITAIHEKYGKQTAMVTVKDGDMAKMDFKFKASDAKSGN
jgi:hypothetical protein